MGSALISRTTGTGAFAGTEIYGGNAESILNIHKYKICNNPNWCNTYWCTNNYKHPTDDPSLLITTTEDPNNFQSNYIEKK